jgi:signal transduction histidine kinase
MTLFSDEAFIEALQERFRANRQAMGELSQLTRELQALNTRLQESEKLKSSFLSSIRNQMNNPLASMLGLAAIMVSLSPGQPGRSQELAALMYEEALSLDFQLKNIFMAAELEAGEVALEGADVEVLNVLDGLLAAYQPCIGKKQLILQRVEELTGTSAAFAFRTDPAKLGLILSNVIANAIEFSPVGGTIRIRTCLQEGRLQVLVHNEGPEINGEDQKVIFDRFTQLDSGITKVHPGSGLGLSVTQALLELLDGRIAVESSARKGTTFIISLPQLPDSVGFDDLATSGNEFFFNREALL